MRIDIVLNRSWILKHSNLSPTDVCTWYQGRVYGGTRGTWPPNFWTRGDIISFLPPNILWWKVM